VLELVRAATEYLGRHGVESPRLDAEVLLADLLKVRRLDLYVRFDMPLDQAAKDAYRTRLVERARGRPVSRIVGYREFYGRRVEVEASVLSPRPETELLADEGLAFLRKRRASDPDRRLRILEIGVGSGALLATLAAEFPAADYCGVDLSPEAVAVARRNCVLLAPETPCDLRVGDLYAPFRGAAPFDLIVSNPPYVSDAEWAELPREVRDYDPALALRSGADPVRFFARLLDESAGMLAENGLLAVEGGAGLPEFLARRTGPSAPWSGRLAKDLAGLPRVLVFEPARPAADQPAAGAGE
jgi:release factor glutamine methyltransferase